MRIRIVVAKMVAAIAVFLSFNAAAATFRVTPEAAGGGDGSSWANAMTLAEAVSATLANDTILCKAGEFIVTNQFSFSTAVTIRGGYAGTDDTTLAADPFSTLNATNDSGIAAIFTVANAAGKAVRLENLVLTRGGRGLVKTGAGEIGLYNCGFIGNRARSSNLNGIGVSLTGSATTHAVISNCVIAGNTSGYTSLGNGQGLYLSTFASVLIEDTLFVTNGIAWTGANFWNEEGRDGQVASAIYVTGAPVTAKRCRFFANRGSCYSSRGSTVRVCGASGGSRFEHCRWVGNEEDYHWFDTSTPVGGSYSGQLVLDLANATDTVTVKNCTMAYNHTGNALSGAGLTVVKGKAVVSDSIIAHNFRGTTCTVGADLCLLSANAYADVSYSMFTTNDIVSVTSSIGNNLNLSGNIVYSDPKFVTAVGDARALLVGIGSYPTVNFRLDVNKLAEVLALDVHPLSSEGYFTNDGSEHQSAGVLSPAVDGGDPAHSVSEEPSPNGGIVNLGVYGGTAEASKTPYGDPAVAGDIAVTFEEPYSRPVVTFTVGGEGLFSASATVYISTNGTDWCYVSDPIAGLALGDVVVYPVNDYFYPGTLQAKVVLSGGGYTHEYVSATVAVEGTMPPWTGKGGPANVIHVRPGAIGAGTGANWSDAVVSFREAYALVSAEKNEIWLAGTNTLAVGSMTLSTSSSFALRGGFTGAENTAEERAEGELSVIDGNDQTDCFTLANTAPALIERVVFKSGQSRGLVKSGAGDLAVLSCLFLTNGLTATTGTGKGAAVGGSSTTTVIFSNCVFRANRTKSSGGGYAPYGGGVNASGCKILRLEACDFIHNGIPLLQPNSGTSYDSMSGGIRGSAVYSSIPVSAVGCRFVANFGNIRDSDGYGGTVRLVTGAGGSAFTNCVFAGNTDRIVWASSTSGNNAGGALVVHLTSTNDTVDVENCTFAHNLADGYTSPAGVNVRSGNVRIRNSIFHCNRLGSTSTDRGADINVKSNSTCTVSYTLFDEPGTNSVTCDSISTTNFLEGVIFGDPLFVTEDATVTNLIKKSGNYINYDWTSASSYSILEGLNLHLRGKLGYRDETAGEIVAFPNVVSPAIDAGDPASDFENEPYLNGRRVNLGFYGNTPYATQSPLKGTLIFLK